MPNAGTHDLPTLLQGPAVNAGTLDTALRVTGPPSIYASSFDSPVPIRPAAMFASMMLGLLVAACESAPLHPVDAGNAAPIPDAPTPDATAPDETTLDAAAETSSDVHATLINCDNGVGAVGLAMPCLLGMTPVSEVDCALAADPSQKLRVLLPLSLPETPKGEPTLGQPTRFHPTFVPLAPMPSLPGDRVLRSVEGTVVFTSYSLSAGTFDGSFTHLELVWASSQGSPVTCTLDNGRFTGVPGGFL
jgi:hypothetical protein